MSPYFQIRASLPILSLLPVFDIRNLKNYSWKEIIPGYEITLALATYLRVVNENFPLTNVGKPLLKLPDQSISIFQ